MCTHVSVMFYQWVVLKVAMSVSATLFPGPCFDFLNGFPFTVDVIGNGSSPGSLRCVSLLV